MDTHIRALMNVAQKAVDDKGRQHLQKAFDLLKNVAESRSAGDGLEALGQDLYVICAEIAFQQHGKPDMAKECLKMYFMKTPPANQFLCRAYLTQAMILAPTSAENPEQLEKAIVYLLKAIVMAKENPRYHFLVYNASVVYWQFSRPFLKPRYRQYLAPSLHQVVKALDDIDDKDYEWRAQLMVALIECHMDARNKTDASHIATAATSFIKTHVPHLYKTVFGLMVRYQLAETAKFQKDLKSPELNVYYRICKIKQAIDTNDASVDVYNEMRLTLISMGASEEAFPPREPAVKETKEKGGRRSATPDADRPFLLLELGRLACEQNEPTIAAGCVDLIKETAHKTVKDPAFFLEVEFLSSELMVKCLGNKQESFIKAAVDLRLQAIKRCDEAILNAVRQGDPKVIQAGCVTQWNLCLPMLQPNLRKDVRKPLTIVAQALEDIHSLLIQLRCQAHMELAKMEEDQEQIQVAMDHLRKALALDDGQVYQERLQVALRRLELRSELYHQPERPEDQAAMIIEQARKADSGTIRMKRSLLVKAGQALAPDTFLLVLESENEAKEVTSVKGPTTVFKKLGTKARDFQKNVKKAEGHLRRLGDENDKERAHLWGDLARTARKQEVWDVCRVATRFCLLYDDGRWKNEAQSQTAREVQNKTPRSKSDVESQPDVPAPSDAGRSVSQTTEAKPDPPLQREKTKDRLKDRVQSASPERKVPLYEKDLIRLLAEVHFVNGEALIHLLRSEGVELNNDPIPPVDKSKKPKGYVAKRPEEDEDWIEYCDWIKGLSREATDCFLRAASLGVELGEPWLVCSSAAYIWNYNNHILQNSRHREIVDTLLSIIEAMKKVGHAGETVLLVNVCNALAVGLIQPWLPQPASDAGQLGATSPTTGRSKTPDRGKSPKRAKGGLPSKGSKPSLTVTISPDASPDLKRAIEVCEYAMGVTNGQNTSDLVPIYVRYPLLQSWVQAKQMLQSQISKTYGTNDENDMEGQNAMTRAMVAIEMLMLTNNGILEFKEAPALEKAYNLVDAPAWSDKLIALQLWTKLAYIAYEVKDHGIVAKAALRALEYAESGTHGKGKKDSHRSIVEQEMLSYAAVIYGQSLIDSSQGKNSIRRKAMEKFLASANHACNAKNYDLVLTAARHYWNAALPLVNQPMERELLKEPITQLLHCINVTTDKSKYKIKDEDELEGGSQPKVRSAHSGISAIDMSREKIAESQKEVEKSLNQGSIGGADDDLTLRASLYGVLFQSYADKGEWEAAMKAMDKAIADMPRTNHRLLIFKHLVVVKAKLGVDVGMSIQKFKDECEDYVAHMWRRVALCSKEQLEQLQAYQNAIESLNSPQNEWQKFDYLLEFGQWLYCNEFPLEDAINQFEWAIGIVLNMKFEEEPKETAKGKRSSKSSKRGGKTPPTSAPKKKEKEKDKEKSPSKKGSKKDVKEDDASVNGRKSSIPSEKSAEGINVADFVPVQKYIPIGVVPKNLNLTIADLKDARQLEGLFRTYVLMAQVAGHAAHNYTHYIITAYAYLVRLWQVSVGSCGPIIKELAKQAAAEPPKDNKGSAKGKPGKKGQDKEVVKEKPKRKGPLDTVPSSIEEWASYDAPDEALEAFKHETMKTSGINTHTFIKPSLTLLYLDVLTEHLCSAGYTPLALPVLAMSDVLARDLLQNRPLHAMIHLKAQQICESLNLLQAAHFHKSLADVKLNEDELTKSREEMSLWKEKQLQVAKEEQRIREALEKLRGKSADPIQKLPEGDNLSLHLGQQIGAIKFRDTWTETAELLINQTLYQPARELLNEALQTSKVFEDKPLEAKVLYLLAMLSYREAQYGQAVNLCTSAQQTYDGDEMFWYRTSMLIVDATMKDYAKKETDRMRKARSILIHALNIFTDVAEMRPNKLSITGYILAKMEAKLGSIQALIALHEHKDIMELKVATALKSACQKLDHAAIRLIELGYERDGISIMKEQADIMITIARSSKDADYKHSTYIEALTIMQEALNVSNVVFTDVHTLPSLSELRHVSTPVQREHMDLSLAAGELMLEMFTLYVEEDRDTQLENQRKGSVLRTLQEYIHDDSQYTEQQKEWLSVAKTLGDSALALLSNAHSLSSGLNRHKAQSLLGVGKCLRQLSNHKNPDRPLQWSVFELSLLQINKQISSNPAVAAAPLTPRMEGTQSGGGFTERSELVTPPMEEAEEEVDVTSKTYMKYSTCMLRDKTNAILAQQYMAQASQCLTQACNLALSKGFKDVAGAAALELVECLGQFDPGLSSQYLALYQSCSASLHLESLVSAALVDPTLSQQAALLNQLETMNETSIASNANNSPLYSQVVKKLEEASPAWRRLSVMPNHMELLKEFPPNFQFVIMQHSPDKKYLYGSLLEKPKAGGPPKGSQKNTSLQASSKAKVVRVERGKHQLRQLLKRWASYKHNVAQFLLKLEYQRTLHVQREKMLANLGEAAGGDGDQEKKGNTLGGEWEADDARLAAEFTSLLQDMEAYLAPVTTLMEAVLRPGSATTQSSQKKNAAPQTPEQEYVVLLADPDLLEMPLEGLTSLAPVDLIISLTREVSLQMLYHKFHVEQSEESPDNSKAKKEKDKNKPQSRIPGLRDANKKQSKIIPLDRKVEPPFIPSDTHAFKYIVDPMSDCSETETSRPAEVLDQVMEEHSQQFTPRWLGVSGTEHSPSPAEYEIYLQESSSFIFYGMEHLLAYLPPHKVAAANLPETQMVLLYDRAQTNSSFLRQAKTDVLKPGSMIRLERSVESALLLGLTGVKTVFCNQWYCTLQENADKLRVMMDDMLAKGRPAGQVARYLFDPQRRVREEKAEQEALNPPAPPPAQDPQAPAGDGEEEQVTEPPTEQEEVKEEPKPTRSWYNMVCYGLPTVVVTQVGKV